MLQNFWSNVTVFVFIAAICLLAIILALSFFFYKYLKNRKRRKLEREAYLELETKIRETFGVEFSTLRENLADQNTVVEIVNTFAEKVALACVEQDRSTRTKNTGTPESFFGYGPEVSWTEATKDLREIWYEARKLASRAVPHLLDYMLYFDQFEPLKTYNAEHRAHRLKFYQ